MDCYGFKQTTKAILIKSIRYKYKQTDKNKKRTGKGKDSLDDKKSRELYLRKTHVVVGGNLNAAKGNAVIK